MNIGLIQVDGKMPNLALMKLSAWHKSKGDFVSVMYGDVVATRLIEFDKIYISVIFEDNKDKALQLQKQFMDAEIGGVGVNNNQLPDEIEHMMPDYDAFKCDYSIGFTTRGCLRNCDFCKVRQQEGLIRKHTDIYEFRHPDHNHIVLLDNNILAVPRHFEKIAEQIMKENLTVDFNQGLDIRLLTDKNAKILNKLKVKPTYRFAFDTPQIEPYIRKGVKILRRNGINRATFYVLVGFDTTLDQDLHRLEVIKELDMRPYVMRYKSCHGKKIYTDLSAWANQQQFFMATDFEEFRFKRNHRKAISVKVLDSKTKQETLI